MNPLGPFGHPALTYAMLVLRSRYARVRSGELSRGASAIEWVIITVIIAGAAVAIGGVIMRIINREQRELENL